MKIQSSFTHPHAVKWKKSKSPEFQKILFTASLKPKALSEVETQAQQHVYGVNIVQLG